MTDQQSNQPGALPIVELLNINVDTENLNDGNAPEVTLTANFMSSIITLPTLRLNFNIGKVAIKVNITVYERDYVAQGNHKEIPF